MTGMTTSSSSRWSRASWPSSWPPSGSTRGGPASSSGCSSQGPCTQPSLPAGKTNRDRPKDEDWELPISLDQTNGHCESLGSLEPKNALIEAVRDQKFYISCLQSLHPRRVPEGDPSQWQDRRPLGHLHPVHYACDKSDTIQVKFRV